MERVAYSIPEAAASLCVSQRTLWRYIKSGDVPSFRIGQRVLIPATGLQDFVSQQTAIQAEACKTE